jgi:hypothetical protein
MAYVALIQESWIHGDQIRGLTSSGGTIISVVPNSNVGSCIYVRNHINALSLLELCSREITTVRMTYICGGSCEELIITSVYLP